MYVIDEQTYLQFFLRSSIDGGSYNDFTTIFWILKYLQHSIYVWNNNNGRIMVKIGDQ
jgi:hypothetical protein